MKNTEKLLTAALKKRFPKMWIKPLSEWDGYGDNSVQGVWTGEGSYDEDGFSIFNYYGEPWQIHPDVEAICDEFDVYCEWNDPGTIHIYCGCG